MTYSPAHTAEVRAHNRVMRYSRFGSGVPVLLLRDPSRDGWSTLHERLAAHFKVIVPNVPADTADVPCWLSNLLEGLGAAGMAVVAVGEHCDTGLALALADNDLVGRVVLIADPDTESWDDRVAEARGTRSLSLFVIPGTTGAEQTVDLTRRYLDAG